MVLRWTISATLVLLLASAAPAQQQQWFVAQTPRVTAYSAGGEPAARNAALRAEQVIAVFGEIFHRTDVRVFPPLRVNASPAAGAPALVRSPLANFVSGDPTQPESWTPAARAIATVIIEENYPHAQPWFDSGFASYLAAVRFDQKQMTLGAAPPGITLPSPAEWIPFSALMARGEPSKSAATTHPSQFEAESWALVRWIVGNGRQAHAGRYLEALSRGATAEEAVREGFEMELADLDREVRESLTRQMTVSYPLPGIDPRLFFAKRLTAGDVYALRTAPALFGPAAESTLKEFATFMRADEDNGEGHRALAWAFLLRHDQANAIEHIRRALTLDNNMPDMHYLYSVWVNQGDEQAIHVPGADVRLGYQLKEAISQDANYGPAYELLGLAQLNAEATKPAVAYLQKATALRPRQDRYFLNLARAQEEAGDLDAARRLLFYVREGNDPTAAAEAESAYRELGKQRAQKKAWDAMGITVKPEATPSKYDDLDEAIAADERAEAARNKPPAAPDSRKAQHMSARLIGVTCEAAAGATVTLRTSAGDWRMHVADRGALLLMGTESFDCGWRNIEVSVNYKLRGKLEGDLVSLEVK